jgi:hypothetical protein
MKNQVASAVSLAIVLFAAATVALRAAARRPQARPVSGTEPAPVTVTGGFGHEMARPPGPAVRPASLVQQMQQVFHELHADGRHAVCTVCDGQYASA